MMRYSYATVALPTLRPEEAVATLVELGYEGVEWKVGDPPDARISDARRFLQDNLCTLQLTEEAGDLARRLAQEAGLEVVGLNPYIGHDDLPGLEAALRMAARAGAPQVRVQAPRLPAGGAVDVGRLLTEFRRFISSGVERASHAGVRLVIELHHRTLLPSVGLAKPLLKDFDPSDLGVIYDAGNLVREGYEDYRLGLAALGPYLHHVHLKNARAVRRDDGRWEYEWSPLDDGLVDVEWFLAALREAGYGGWISIEDLSGPLDSVSAAERNAELLRAIPGSAWRASGALRPRSTDVE
jgi:sugar phosphate isomerase/epimerase